MRWTQIGDQIWHIMKRDWVLPNGIQMAQSACGIQQQWNGTSIDALPGGEEVACENCKATLAPAPKPSRRRRRK